MEVCIIAEGQRYSKRLNERQITSLLQVTCQRPQDRENSILQVCVQYPKYLSFSEKVLFEIKIMFWQEITGWF
jgi:hypothetical protein